MKLFVVTETVTYRSETEVIMALVSPETHPLTLFGEPFVPSTINEDWEKDGEANMRGSQEVNGIDYDINAIVNFPNAIKRALANFRHRELKVPVHITRTR